MPSDAPSAHSNRPKRSLSQNFLVDRSAVEAIVAAATLEGVTGVLEIGPGRGALTFDLARRARRLIAVELDTALAAWLASELAGMPTASVIEGDILQTDLEALLGSEGGWAVVGNVPYAVTTPILLKLLGHRSLFRHAVLMVQDEVAARWLAEPGGRDIGAITVWCRYCCDVESVRRVKAGAFRPAPTVDSRVVKLTPRPYEHTAADEAFLQEVTRAAFHQRRKHAVNSLADRLELPIGKDELASLFAALGLGPTARAEEIGVGGYVRLANALLPHREGR